MADTLEPRMKALIFPVMVAIILGTFTVSGGLALYIWNESQTRSDTYRATVDARLDKMQDVLDGVGKNLAVLTAIQERQERDLGRSP